MFDIFKPFFGKADQDVVGHEIVRDAFAHTLEYKGCDLFEIGLVMLLKQTATKMKKTQTFE